MVMGHEAAGTLLQLGEGVKHLNVGRCLVDLAVRKPSFNGIANNNSVNQPVHFTVRSEYLLFLLWKVYLNYMGESFQDYS